MEKLAESVSKFIHRDIIYITGGASVLICFFVFSLRIEVPSKIPNSYIVFVALVSYVIGFACQELFAIMGITILIPPCNSSDSDKWLYKQFNKHVLSDTIDGLPDNNDYEALSYDFYGSNPNVFLSNQFQRIISLKQIGTTVFPCWVISLILILSSGVFKLNCSANIVVLVVMIALLIALYCTGKIHLFMQREFLKKWLQSYKKTSINS